MNAVSQHHVHFNVAETLRIEHNAIRAALVSASAEPGPIGKAAKRAARRCRAHFEQEERIVFPLFGLLNRLASDDLHPDMADLQSQFSEFCAAQLGTQQQTFDAAIEALLQLARTDEGGKFVALVDLLERHERLENEVVYPTVILMGKYLHLSRAQPSAPQAASAQTWQQRAQPTRTAASGKISADALDVFLDDLVQAKQHALGHRNAPARALHAVV